MDGELCIDFFFVFNNMYETIHLLYYRGRLGRKKCKLRGWR